MRPVGWVVLVGVLSLAAASSSVEVAPAPIVPPPQKGVSPADPTIDLRIRVDESLARAHGRRLSAFLAEAVAIHNVEWRRVRREWFRIAEIVVEPGIAERDAIYLLSDLVHRTVQEPRTVHVRVSGSPLELYSGGKVRQIGGLAFRGLDAVIVTAVPGTTTDLLAYYLFHEIGHCWDAFDLPFEGGNSTFGSKRFATFEVDAGNAQIMEDSPGPRPRDTPNFATAVIRSKLAAARRLARDPQLHRQLHDLLLHDASSSNPAYVAKRSRLLARSGVQRRAVARFLARYEVTARQAREEAATRRELSGHYWVASDAIARGDTALAAEALRSIETLLAGESGDTRLLVAAVGRKVRRAQRGG